jgi:hypothetical protein
VQSQRFQRRGRRTRAHAPTAMHRMSIGCRNSISEDWPGFQTLPLLSEFVEPHLAPRNEQKGRGGATSLEALDRTSRNLRQTGCKVITDIDLEPHPDYCGLLTFRTKWVDLLRRLFTNFLRYGDQKVNSGSERGETCIIWDQSTSINSLHTVRESL